MIYLFCNKGTLLAPLLVALYLSIYEGMNLKKALEFVKEKYPPSAIDENIIAMANDVANQNYFQP
jgi:predicted P-loop ATPase